MKVRELINLLENCPGDALVQVECGDAKVALAANAVYEEYKTFINHTLTGEKFDSTTVTIARQL